MRCTAHDRWVTGFDGGVDAGGFGIGGKDCVDEGVEVGICVDVGWDKEVGFIGDVGEDEGGDAFVVVSCWYWSAFLFGYCTLEIVVVSMALVSKTSG